MGIGREELDSVVQIAEVELLYLIDRDSEAEALFADSHNLHRVYADHHSSFVNERPAAVSCIYRGVGLDVLYLDIGIGGAREIPDAAYNASRGSELQHGVNAAGRADCEYGIAYSN